MECTASTAEEEGLPQFAGVYFHTPALASRGRTEQLFGFQFNT